MMSDAVLTLDHPAAQRRRGVLPALGRQILSFANLRVEAPLGILAHERAAPQMIRVDVELNQGLQPLQPGDHIQQVLDYRQVRQIILDECTAEHVNLLESLVGQLALHLGRLPGILGVRVKVAKLHIFDNCEVAICMESGSWDQDTTSTR
jgi:dihydroneopterin aldolase